MTSPIITLIGDLGGTNCRLQLMRIADDEVTLYQKRYLSSEYKSLESILVKFLEEHHINDLAHEHYPQKVVICVAGPVSNIHEQVQNSIHYGTGAFSTNLQWAMSSFVIADALKLSHEVVTLVNDFEAVGYGVLGLREGQYVPLTSPDCESRPGAPIAVIGPGTGLGEAFLTSDRQGGLYVVNPSEGGHSTYAPTNIVEFNLLQYIQTEFSCTHASWERVCSGTGIRSIYRYLQHQAQPENPFYHPKNIDIYEHKPTLEQEPVLGAQFPAQIIFEHAQNGDELCTQVVELYLAALGRETGNLAAKMLPYGGIYIAGGMGPKIRWALDSLQEGDPNSKSKVDTTTFLRNAHDKGRLKPFIDKIPVFLVLIDEIGLLGCIYVAKRIGRK